MLKPWKIANTITAILIAMTLFSSIVGGNALFNVFLWLLTVYLLIRISISIKRKFFWKIRNRLIFSSLFLVVTPIICITAFFLLIGRIVIAQYGATIIRSLMDEQLALVETGNNAFLDYYNNPRQIVMAVDDFTRRNHQLNIKVVVWARQGNQFKLLHRSPTHFNPDRLSLQPFKGFFVLNNRLYNGTLRINDHLAALTAMELDRKYLDHLSGFSDFRVEFRHSAKSGSNALSVSDSGFNTQKNHPPQHALDNANFMVLPSVIEYKFHDFDRRFNGKVTQRTGEFVLTSDFDKIYKKIHHTISFSSARGFIYFLIFLFGTFIVGSFFIGFRMVWVITRSINQLTRGTQRIRNGDFSFRIRTQAGGQMQYLADSFNEMAAGIDRLLIDEKEKQRLEEELRIARSIQLKLLPPERFCDGDFDIAAANIPAAEIAGDYFDYFYKPDRYLALLVADVSGKGASAAFYMAELKGVVNHLQQEVVSPRQLIAGCHDSLKGSFDKVTFITMNAALLNIPEKKLTLARAGHTPAIYYSAEQNACSELFPTGVAIGLSNFSEEKINEIQLFYKPGDILFLFSDGLSEIMDEEDEILGIEPLKKLIHENCHLPADLIKQKLLDFSINFSGSSINRDDLTFIVLKINGDTGVSPDAGDYDTPAENEKV